MGSFHPSYANSQWLPQWLFHCKTAGHQRPFIVGSFFFLPCERTGRFPVGHFSVFAALLAEKRQPQICSSVRLLLVRSGWKKCRKRRCRCRCRAAGKGKGKGNVVVAGLFFFISSGVSDQVRLAATPLERCQPVRLGEAQCCFDGVGTSQLAAPAGNSHQAVPGLRRALPWRAGEGCD